MTEVVIAGDVMCNLKAAVAALEWFVKFANGTHESVTKICTMLMNCTTLHDTQPAQNGFGERREASSKREEEEACTATDVRDDSDRAKK